VRSPIGVAGVVAALLFTLDGDRVRGVDQFVGDPGAVAAFWA
jgi:hypothetical protein